MTHALTADQLDVPNLLASLRSDLCPICQGHKQPSQTMCRRDYHRLPPRNKKLLYQRVGEGYEQAVAAAMAALNVSTFYAPESPFRRKEQ